MSNIILGSNTRSRPRIIWTSIIALLPSVILLMLGIAFIRYSTTQIYDLENYLPPSQKPLAQNYAIFKLALGGGLGLIIGGIFAYLVIHPKRQNKEKSSLLFWLKLVSLGSVLLLSGGLPKPEYQYIIPLTDITAAWTPFRIGFSPGWIMGCGLVFFVLSVKMIKKRWEKLQIT